jgi:dihydrofolate synthase / folylpolyglutamate synthase
LSSLTYAELVAELFPRLTGGIRWGLDRTQRMLAEVGDPHRSYRVVHVGGTNGKGSVAAHVESVLRHAGRRTGLYTSPHLCTFRERIRIGGNAIGEDALLASAQRLWPVIRRESPSFFEATTAIALLALAEAGVEDAVVEVGLGGRLDATNVVDPAVVVLTNVSLDHVQLLGPTLEHVAREKAGIIKAGVPVVTAERDVPAAMIFAAAAADVGAPIHTLDPAALGDVEGGAGGTTFRMPDTRWGALHVHTPLPGVHQALNAALAVRALEVLHDAGPPLARDAIVGGVAATRWPGRLQFERVAGVTWLFDVAHNAAGVAALVAALDGLALPRPLIAVVGVLGDKDWQRMVGPICDRADLVLLCTPPTAPAERLWSPPDVLAAGGWTNAVAEPSFTGALEAAQRQAARAGGAVLVTGSFHTVGDACAALGLCRDGVDTPIPPVSFAARR